MVLSPALRTRMRRRDWRAMCWRSGNESRTTSTSNVPSGSFLSWRSPPPHPAANDGTSSSTPTMPRRRPFPIAAGTYQCAGSCAQVGREGAVNGSLLAAAPTVTYPSISGSPKGRLVSGSFRRRSWVLARQEPARRGRGHDDPHGEDDHVCPASAVSVRRRVRGSVPLRLEALLVPAAGLHRGLRLRGARVAGGELPRPLRRAGSPRRVLRARVDPGVRAVRR